jgi:zinc protease
LKKVLLAAVLVVTAPFAARAAEGAVPRTPLRPTNTLVAPGPTVHSRQSPPITHQTPLGPVTELVLANGLTVILEESHTSPVVSLNMTYRVGARNEGPGETGSAHLLEHMLFKGTKIFGKGQIAQLLGRNGANYNASTWPDYTNYYETYSSDRLALGFVIESSRMRDALILDAERQSEMTVVRNEMEGDESDPSNGLYQEITELAYRSHPYHHPTIGYRGDVEGIQTARLRRFYERYYMPNNAVMTLVGDFKTADAIALAHAYFDRIAAGPEPPLMHTTEEAQMGERRLVLRRQGESNLLEVAFHIPQASSRDIAPLMVLDAFLTNGVTGRLHQALVEADQASRVWSEVGIQRDSSLFRIGCDLKPAQGNHTDHAEVEAALWRSLDRLRTSWVPAEDLVRAKRQTQAANAFANDGVEELAQELGAFAVRDRWQRAYELQAQIAAVTPQDLNRVIKAYFTRDNATTGWYISTSDGPVQPVPTNKGGGVARGAHANIVPPPPYDFEREIDHGQRTSLPTRLVLANGLELWVLENPGSRTVAFDGYVRAGHALDPKNKAGVAEATANMLDLGSKRHDKLAEARQLEDVGATLDFEAGPTVTTLVGQCLADDAPQVVEALAERLREPVFLPLEFEKLADTWKFTLAQSEDEPATRARRALARAIFPLDHPLYQRTPIEAAQQIDAIGPADLVAFHHDHYGPNTTVLVVTGNITAQHAREWVEKAFAGWQPVTEAPQSKLDTPLNAPGVEVIELASKTETQIFMGHAASVRRTDPGFFAYALANDILGGDTWSSRLGAKLRDEMGLTYGTYSEFDPNTIPGPWEAIVSVNPANVKSAISAMREEIARFAQTGVTDAELAFAKRSFIGSQAHSLATNVGMAHSIARMALFDLGTDYWVRYAALIERVTRDEVNAAARDLIHPDALHLVVVGPGAKAALTAPSP